MRKDDEFIIKGPSKKKQKQNRSYGNILSTLVLIIALSVMGTAGYKLYNIMEEYQKGVSEYSDIKDTAVSERSADQEEIDTLQPLEREEQKKWKAPIAVDFEELKSINKDVVGWLYMEALPDISYPIVKGNDNSFYLHRTYKGEENFAGAIFIDCENSADFSDQNTIVYGHNMKNGSMFGSLKKYKEKETINKSQFFWIITPEEDYRYMIFSIYVAAVGGDTYTLIKGPGKETIQYAQNMKEKSLFDLGERDFIETDKIITLSTCTGDEATRFVVQGIRIEP